MLEVFIPVDEQMAKMKNFIICHLVLCFNVLDRVCGDLRSKHYHLVFKVNLSIYYVYDINNLIFVHWMYIDSIYTNHGALNRMTPENVTWVHVPVRINICCLQETSLN